MINGIQASDPVSGLSKSVEQGDLGKDAFMTLLVNQLKNQNPLAPTDNEAFIAQLAQFSSLEEMEELNDNIVGLAVLQQGNALMSQLTDSSALIGKSVKYVDPESGDTLDGVVDSVKIVEGVAVLNIGGGDVPLANVTEVTGAADSGSDDNDEQEG